MAKKSAPKVPSNIEFRLIIPKNDNSGKRIPRAAYEPYLQEISTKFGGFTLIPNTYGCYYGDDKVIQCEESFMVIASELGIGRDQNEDKKFVGEIAKKMGIELGQSDMFVHQTIGYGEYVSGQKTQSLDMSKYVESPRLVPILGKSKPFRKIRSL